ncbi:MAG: hypothetical protein ACRDJN_20330, partial [Chloroflexota bacterium]
MSGDPDAVVQLLQAHGIPESTARLLAPVGEALRNEAVRLQVEHAASFDIDSGAPAGPLRVGRSTEVDITDQLAAMRPDRCYVSIHTHRTSAAFSDLDLDLLLKNALIRTVAAVGHDGTWHLLSKRPDALPADPEVGVRALHTVLARLSPNYLAEVRSGRLTRVQALRRVLHTTWRIVAAPLGLRYDRS